MRGGIVYTSGPVEIEARVKRTDCVDILMSSIIQSAETFHLIFLRILETKLDR